MYGTLEMMKGIIRGKEKELENIDFISEYKNNNSDILAYLFVNNFGAIIKLNNLYPNINEQDKASFCLQELDKTLRTYNNNKNTKFLSYFLVLYRNRLKAENNLLEMQKRKIMNDYEEISNCQSYVEDDYFTDIDEILNQYDLTKKEKQHWKLLNEGYTMKEVAKKLKTSVNWIYQRNYIIKNKILNTI